jgi:uncharacterized protein YbjQ (UPF0145 family)
MLVAGIEAGPWQTMKSVGCPRQAREDAHSGMLKHAESLGADAVIATRYQTTPFGTAGTSEYVAYGTAVRLVP